MSVFGNYLLPVAALLMLGGCTAEVLPERDSVPIQLMARMEEGPVTRAGTAVQDTQFASGETFNAYFPTGASVTNTTFQTVDGSGNTECSGTAPYMQVGVSSCTVHAYYPSSVNQSSASFSVALDQRTDAGYKASDLMYASATVTKAGASATGSLTFNHRMSKIVVTAVPGSGVASITAIRIVGGKRTINVATPLSCTLGSTLSDAITTVSSLSMWSGESAESVSCAALIPPQTISGDFLQIDTNLGTATYSLDSKAFAQGSSYQFTITVKTVDIGARTGYTAGGHENWN